MHRGNCRAGAAVAAGRGTWWRFSDCVMNAIVTATHADVESAAPTSTPWLAAAAVDMFGPPPVALYLARAIVALEAANNGGTTTAAAM